MSAFTKSSRSESATQSFLSGWFRPEADIVTAFFDQFGRRDQHRGLVFEGLAMNTTKVSEWLQMTAAIGMIVGLFLVAYEIRISNRIGIDQANAESVSRYGAAYEIYSTAEVADLFVRANEGEGFSRIEMVRLDNLLNIQIGAWFYDWTLSEAGTISLEGGFSVSYGPVIQWYLGSPIGRRKWEIDRGDWPTAFSDVIANALAAPIQRNVLGEIDYLRGATDSVE